MKKGITILTLTIIVIIMSLLAGAGIYTSNDVLKSVRKNQLAIELLSIQTAIDNYYIDNKAYPITESIQINIKNFGSFERAQFNDENITEDVVTLNKINLNILGIKETTLGNNTNPKDVYAVSTKTGKVYYIQGVLYRGETHYTLNSKLSEAVNDDIGVNGKRIQVKDVIFVVSSLENTTTAVNVTVVLPEAATLDNITATNSVQVGAKTKYKTYQHIPVNTTNVVNNYEIEVTYTLNKVQNIVRYNVSNVDNSGPSIEISAINHTGYTTLQLTYSDSGIDSIKYEVGNITDATYFKNFGKIVEGTEINCYKSGIYTIYAIDSLGNVTLKQQSVTVN